MTIYEDGLPRPRRYWAILAISLGTTMAVLDSTLANVALPSIAHAVNSTPARSIWVINAYQLVIAMTLLPLASLGETLGYRRVFKAGLLVFTAGSLACALSVSLWELIGARALQGLGAAGVMSVVGALVRYTYPQAGLGRGIGISAMTVSIAGAIGPSIAAGILALGSWQWLFVINIPLGLANSLLASAFLPESERVERPVDWNSAWLNAVVFASFFLGLDALTHPSRTLLPGAIYLIIATAGGVLLIQRQAALPRPLVPLDLLRSRIFALSIAVSVCAFTAYALAFVALPFYFESGLQRTPVATGLLMTPLPVAMALTAPLAGRLSDRAPAGLLVAIGLVLFAVGLALLARLSQHPSPLDIGWRVALSGVGFGLFQTPNNRVLLSSAPRARAGAAGGMLATARQVGMTSGAALVSLIFGLSHGGREAVCLIWGAGICMAAAVVSLLRLSK